MFSSRIQCMLFTLLVTFTYFEKYLTMRGGAISLMCLFQPPPIFFALPRPPPGRCCQLLLHHTCAHPATRRSFDVLSSIVHHCRFPPRHIDPKRKHTLSSLSPSGPIPILAMLSTLSDYCVVPTIIAHTIFSLSFREKRLPT